MVLIRAVVFLAFFLALAHGQQCSGMASFSSGSYMLEYEVFGSSGSYYINFTVSVNTSANTWVGVGISSDRSMFNSDVMIAANDGTNEFVEDRWVNSVARVPMYDTQQNLMNTMTDRDGMTLTFSFTRAINSPDPNGNQDLDLNVCRYFIFAWGGTVTTFPSGNTPATLMGHSMTNRGILPNQVCLCGMPGSAASASISFLLIAVAAMVAIAGLLL